ncbi:hypothetical protein MGAST_00240 [Mycobacterium gastri 'Wayne']|nr:hypothetical protein MGAST_00240 [Mycobacterium gastri 'Wayne']
MLHKPTRRECNHGGTARRVAGASAHSAQPVHTRRSRCALGAAGAHSMNSWELLIQVLKSPQHGEQLGPLIATFPDATTSIGIWL